MIDLSSEEIALLHHFAGERQRSRIGFYLSVLATPLAFAIYGALNRDVIAMAIAFFGQFAFVVWVLRGDTRQAATLRSIATRLLASGNKRDPGTPS